MFWCCCCCGQPLDIITMSLLTFRTLVAELKHVPCETDPISKQIKNKDLARCLSTAMKALAEAETVIAKQEDAILHSTNEISSYLHEKRASESLPNDLPTSTPKDTADKYMPIWEVETNRTIKNESSNTEPTSYCSAVKTASTNRARTVLADRATESQDAFRVVNAPEEKKDVENRNGP